MNNRGKRRSIAVVLAACMAVSFIPANAFAGESDAKAALDAAKAQIEATKPAYEAAKAAFEDAQADKTAADAALIEAQANLGTAQQKLVSALKKNGDTDTAKLIKDFKKYVENDLKWYSESRQKYLDYIAQYPFEYFPKRDVPFPKDLVEAEKLEAEEDSWYHEIKDQIEVANKELNVKTSYYEQAGMKFLNDINQGIVSTDDVVAAFEKSPYSNLVSETDLLRACNPDNLIMSANYIDQYNEFRASKGLSSVELDTGLMLLATAASGMKPQTRYKASVRHIPLSYIVKVKYMEVWDWNIWYPGWSNGNLLVSAPTHLKNYTPIEVAYYHPEYIEQSSGGVNVGNGFEVLDSECRYVGYGLTGRVGRGSGGFMDVCLTDTTGDPFGHVMSTQAFKNRLLTAVATEKAPVDELKNELEVLQIQKNGILSYYEQVTGYAVKYYEDLDFLNETLQSVGKNKSDAVMSALKTVNSAKDAMTKASSAAAKASQDLSNKEKVYTSTKAAYDTAEKALTSAEEAYESHRISIENADIVFDASVEYDGKPVRPTPAVMVGGKKLGSADMDVTYENNNNVGIASMKIAGRGEYKGEVAKEFQIVPARTALNLKSRKKRLTVRWKKASGADGYQIMLSRSKSFKKGNRVVKVNGTATTSKVVKSLASKKTYYVKVRTYATVDGIKYYSKWSSVRAAKTK